MSLMRNRRRDQRGLVSVIVAISALALIVVAALVIDGGSARLARRSSQNAADAASLAGANMLYPKTGVCVITTSETTPPCFRDAVKAVKDYAAFNIATTSTWASCTDPDKDAGSYTVPGESACISFYGQSAPYTSADSQTAPYSVRVRIPQRAAVAGLGSITGRTSIAVSSKARATLKPGTGRSCGLCVIGTDVNQMGNGDVIVNGGSIHLNGSADIGPNGHLTATPTGMTITATGTCPSGCSPAAVHADLIADPLATTLTLPPPYPASYTSVKSDPCSQGPGIYASISFSNNTNCPLVAGLYVVTGTWQLGNNTVLSGTGVTLYFTCATAGNMPRACASPGEAGGQFDAKNGNVSLVAPTASPPPVSGALAGYVLIYDRMNTAPLTMQGNADTNYTGTIYAPKALMTFPGTTCVNVVNGPVIVSQLYGNGNTGCVNLTSVNGAFIPTPPEGVSLDQ